MFFFIIYQCLLLCHGFEKKDHLWSSSARVLEVCINGVSFITVYYQYWIWKICSQSHLSSLKSYQIFNPAATWMWIHQPFSCTSQPFASP